MAFTYDLSTAIGKVRLLVPDNNSTSYLLEDDEIDYFLAQRGSNAKAAAADCCDQLARQFALKPSFSADGLSVSNGERANTFAARARELRGSMMSAVSSVTLNRSDGYEDEATTSEYEDRTVYIKV
jgi:hypothetical protein